MKPVNSILSAILIGSALTVAGAAHAAPVEREVVQRAIDDTGVGGVDVSINDEGIARLTGKVDDSVAGQLAVKAAGNVPGITGVVDRLRTDDD